MSKGKIFVLVGGIFAVVGLIFVVVGVGVGVSAVGFQSSAEKVDGKVVALNERVSSSRSSSGPSRTSTTWYPVVEYTVDGERYEFEASSGSNPPAHEVGEAVEVAYDPADPGQAELAGIGGALILPLIFGGLGIVLAPVGTVLFVKGRRTLARQDWLRRNGQEVWAEIAHIGPEFTVRINGRHPYVVRATWRDASTGRSFTATSDYVREDPGPTLQGQTHVRVLFDPADPDRNLLELNTATATRAT